MTKEESLLVSAYTGVMICKDFSDLHEYIEQVMKRPVFTHEMGNDLFHRELKGKLHSQIIDLVKNIKD